MFGWMSRRSVTDRSALRLPEGETGSGLPPPPDIPDGLADMLPMFVAEMEKDGATLSALAEGAAADLAEHAHAMRGKCAMFGEETLFEVLTRIEECATEGRVAGIPPLIARAIERVGQLRLYGTPDLDPAAR